MKIQVLCLFVITLVCGCMAFALVPQSTSNTMAILHTVIGFCALFASRGYLRELLA